MASALRSVPVDAVPSGLPPGEGQHVTEAPFVGRDHEMRELRGALDGALAGRGRLWLLAGEAGIGKTRLAEEIAREAAAKGADVLWGRCWEGEGAPAYWPWLQVLRARLRDLDAAALQAALGSAAVDVAQLLPEVRDRLPDLPAPQGVDPAVARFRLLEGVTTILTAAARARPTLLVLDDLHWADAVSLLLVRFLARALRDAPLLVLGTYRADEIARDDPRLAELTTIARDACRLDLRGLGDADVARLIASTTGAAPASGLVRAVRERTHGNPFFVSELARLLGEEDGEAAVAHAVPREIRETVRRRLERLPPASHQLLRLAAAIGREFTADVLAGAARQEQRAVLGLLDEAATAGAVLPPRTAADPWVFAHGLIRDVLYDELGAAERRDAHGRIGAALAGGHEAGAATSWAEVAHHFFRAAPDGDVDAAVEYAQRAGAQAAEHLAYEEAAAQYGRALAALRLAPAPDGARECALQLCLGEALQLAGDEAGSVAAIERAVTLARPPRARRGARPGGAVAREPRADRER